MVKYLGDAVSDEWQVSVYECIECGFHIGLDATYLEQVSDIKGICTSCSTNYIVKKFE